MIEYKDYIGTFEFDSEIDSFHGTVININDVMTFYGLSVTELRAPESKRAATRAAPPYGPVKITAVTLRAQTSLAAGRCALPAGDGW